MTEVEQVTLPADKRRHTRLAVALGTIGRRAFGMLRLPQNTQKQRSLMVRVAHEIL
jgi:hypothetical protein